MSLIPSWPTVAAGLVVGALAGASGMHVWDASTIAALKVSAANTKANDAEAISKQSQTALSDLADASKTIKEKASAGQVDVAALNTKLDTITRTLKNAKPPALAADCKPGTVRVRNLSDSAAAVDQAISRSVTGR